MKKNLIKKFLCLSLLVVIVMPCWSFAEEYEPIGIPGNIERFYATNKIMTTTAVDIANPGWNGEYEKISDTEYLYPKYLYYQGKFYDLKIKGKFLEPAELKLKPTYSETLSEEIDKVTITLLENGTDIVADLDDLYYVFSNVDRYERYVFDGNITSYIYKPTSAVTALTTNMRFSVYSGKTYLTSSAYSIRESSAQGSYRSATTFYIKSDVTAKNEFTFTHQVSMEDANYYSIGFMIPDETLTLNYEVNFDGQLTSLSSESVHIMQNPTMIDAYKVSPNAHLKYWTCDKDVELKDGSIISSGDAMTQEQFESVVVVDDLTFTAYCDFVEASASATEEQTEPQSETESGTETHSETESGTHSQSETESETHSESGSGAETHSETESETQSQSETESGTETHSETESGTHSHSETESGTGTHSETESGTETHSETESGTQSQSESQTSPTSEQLNQSDENVESNEADESGENDEYDDFSDYELDEDNEDEDDSDRASIKKRLANFVKTGDNKNIAIYSFILIVSLALLRIVRKAL